MKEVQIHQNNNNYYYICIQNFIKSIININKNININMSINVFFFLNLKIKIIEKLLHQLVNSLACLHLFHIYFLIQIIDDHFFNTIHVRISVIKLNCMTRSY